MKEGATTKPKRIGQRTLSTVLVVALTASVVVPVAATADPPVRELEKYAMDTAFCSTAVQSEGVLGYDCSDPPTNCTDSPFCADYECRDKHHTNLDRRIQGKLRGDECELC